MSFVSSFDDFQRRHPKVGFPLAVIYKYVDDQGAYLAALIAYYAFVSLFPLMLLFTTILGWLLQSNQDLKNQILDTAFEQIPVIGTQLHDPEGLTGGTTTVVVGLVGAAYGALGVSVATQNAMNTIWGVPRNSRPNPIKVRLRGAALLVSIGLALIVLVGINIISARLGDGWQTLSPYVGIALGTVVFVVLFRHGTARPVRILDVLPGAVLAALGWQALQLFGSFYITRVVARSRDVTGVFAVVLGLIAFLYLAAVLIVVCLEIDAVRVDRLYPRAVLTEFTDGVRLLSGDVAAYTRYAQMQQLKGFQTIDVRFHNPLDNPLDQPLDDDSPTVPTYPLPERPTND
ncbi:YihY/virulence factor BrkB family protein [Gordonia hydrophobica]|uniref:YihY/virulence factor BrkB family protein n=1 Tax=Gordonia hydrophobica TaxID=40516 RepID=A0ABZ2U5N8_9ACTN|nr:YihY/virulence factor BrkB family protein [Gordonia hydrophobica]MBM7367477.1 YihY family inner membrane protein [Gordonia hydrophobica]